MQAVRWTQNDRRPRMRAMVSQINPEEILASVCVPGPQGETVHWELFWHNKAIHFRTLDWFQQRGSTGIQCEDIGFAPALIKSVFADPKHRHAPGLAWQLNRDESRIWVAVKDQVRTLDRVPEFGEMAVWLAVASMAGTPLPAPSHPFWHQVNILAAKKS